MPEGISSWMSLPLQGPSGLPRCTVIVSSAEFIRFSSLPTGDLPLLAEPASPGGDLAVWAASRRQLIEEKLPQHGGIHPRGFGSARAVLRDSLLEEFSEGELPANSYFVNGSPIQLRAAYRAETVSFPWRQGDLLMLDNILVAYGWAPYAGSREILFGMAEPVTVEQVWIG